MPDPTGRSDFGTAVIKPSLWPGLAMPLLLAVLYGYQTLSLDWHLMLGGSPHAAPSRLLVANGCELLLLAVLFWLYTTGYRVQITDIGVQTCDFLGRRHRVAWDEVLRVENTGNVRLTSATDTVTIREIGFMPTWQRLLDILDQRLPRSVWPPQATRQRRQLETELSRTG